MIDAEIKNSDSIDSLAFVCDCCTVQLGHDEITKLLNLLLRLRKIVSVLIEQRLALMQRGWSNTLLDIMTMAITNRNIVMRSHNFSKAFRLV